MWMVYDCVMMCKKEDGSVLFVREISEYVDERVSIFFMEITCGVMRKKKEWGMD